MSAKIIISKGILWKKLKTVLCWKKITGISFQLQQKWMENNNKKFKIFKQKQVDRNWPTLMYLLFQFNSIFFYHFTYWWKRQNKIIKLNIWNNRRSMVLMSYDVFMSSLCLSLFCFQADRKYHLQDMLHFFLSFKMDDNEGLFISSLYSKMFLCWYKHSNMAWRRYFVAIRR